MILDFMDSDSNFQPRLPGDRTLDGIELLREYDLDIPVELIDASYEDGTDAGRKALLLLEKMAKLEGQAVELLVNRLQSYRDGIGAPPLTTQQHALATLYFHTHLGLSVIESKVALFDGFLATFTPDAAADLKKAMLSGLYEEGES